MKAERKTTFISSNKSLPYSWEDLTLGELKELIDSWSEIYPPESEFREVPDYDSNYFTELHYPVTETQKQADDRLVLEKEEAARTVSRYEVLLYNAKAKLKGFE